MGLLRDRVYLTAVAFTAIAIAAAGFFFYRDFTSPALQKVALGSTLGSSQGSGGVPLSGTSAGAVGGGGGGGSGGSASGGSVAKSVACQGGSITIGQILPITGPVTEKTAQEAVQAYVNQLDQNGGIRGCMVKLISLDDGGLDQQKAAADARELVQQDHVFAVVGNVEPVTDASTASYFAQAGVPVVGVDGVGLAEYGNPVEYSFAESPAGFGISTENYLHSLGFHRPAIFYLDFDFGQASFSAFSQQAKRNGDTVVYSNAENVSSTSYPVDVLSARSANPDVVVNIIDANSAVREMNAMQSNNWFPNMVATTSSSDPVVISSERTWLSNPSHAVYVQRNYEPATAGGAVAQWVATEGRYFPGFDPNSYAEGAWLGMKIFTDLASKEGSHLTREGLLHDLNSLSNYTTGFTVPLTMTGNHDPNRQVIWMRWNGSGFVQISGWRPW